MAKGKRESDRKSVRDGNIKRDSSGTFREKDSKTGGSLTGSYVRKDSDRKSKDTACSTLSPNRGRDTKTGHFQSVKAYPGDPIPGPLKAPMKTKPKKEK